MEAQDHCMAIKSQSLLFVVFNVLFLNLLQAQDMGFRIEIQTRFIQRLGWTADEYALRYEVEIEREEGDAYHRHLLE